MTNCKTGAFEYEVFKKKSVPAGALCNWVKNWHNAASAVLGMGEIKQKMDQIDVQIAIKMNIIEQKEQEKLMNFIPDDDFLDNIK